MFGQRYRKGYVKSFVDGAKMGAKIGAVASSVYKSRKTYQKAQPKRKPAKKKTNLTKKIKKISQQLDSVNSVFIQKNYDFYGVKISTAGQVKHQNFTLIGSGQLEEAINSVKYFNPSSPSTLINVDLSSPTFQNRVLFDKPYFNIRARNNYVVPCRCTLYIVKVKKDTSITPTTSMTNSLTDASNASITTHGIFPTDCHDFNDLYGIVKKKSVVLNAGEEFEISHAFPSFNYDVSLTDSHTSAYQKYFHGSHVLIRVEGITAHGSTAGTIPSLGGVDIQIYRKYVVKYPGGSNIQYLEINNTYDTTASGTIQVSNFDVSQQAYSI